MSFASHDLPDDAPSPTAPVRSPSCPIHAVWPFSVLPRRARAVTGSTLVARFARYGVWGTAAFFALASLKCIILYMVLPALAINACTPDLSESTSKEPSHDAQVSVSCPFASRGVGRYDAAGDHAALRATQGTDAAAAR